MDPTSRGKSGVDMSAYRVARGATARSAEWELAKQFIDRTIEINQRYGMAGTLTPEQYEKAIHDVARIAESVRGAR